MNRRNYIGTDNYLMNNLPYLQSSIYGVNKAMYKISRINYDLGDIRWESLVTPLSEREMIL